MEKRTLMIIGASIEHIIGIEKAKEMGYNVFVTDGNPKSEGFTYADGFRIASTYDHEATLAAALDYIKEGNSIDGVMTLASDIPYTVAFVAEKLNLPGLNLESALNASEKVKMKMLFKKFGVNSPNFFEISNKNDIHSLTRDISFPLVIKPVDSRGARGVQLVSSRDEIEKAYDIAIGFSPSKRIICEEYLSGPQLSTEGFILDGKVYIPAILDRNYEYLERFSPFFVENGGEMPSIYSTKLWEDIHNIMRDAALSLGIKTGVIKGDLVINNGKVKIIELAARMSGGFFGTVATIISTGVDLIKVNIDLAMGNLIDPQRLLVSKNKPTAIRFAFPKSGKLKSVSGIDTIKKNQKCCYAHVFKSGGDYVPNISNHLDRPAVVVASGNDLLDSITTANDLISSLIWEYED